MAKGEYYAEEEDGLYFIFHTETETGHAYASYSTLQEAEEKAAEMNQ